MLRIVVHGLSVLVLVAVAGCSGSGGDSSNVPAIDAAQTAESDALSQAMPDVLVSTTPLLHPPPCASDEFLYDDKTCGHPTSYNPTPTCTQMGDRWCHAKCTKGGTCPDGSPCVAQYLCRGSDACFEYVYICNKALLSPVGGPCRPSTGQHAYPGDCIAPATCKAATDCGDACDKAVCTL